MFLLMCGAFGIVSSVLVLVGINKVKNSFSLSSLTFGRKLTISSHSIQILDFSKIDLKWNLLAEQCFISSGKLNSLNIHEINFEIQ